LDWKRKADMLASYARQINDKSLFDYAVEIRNRARRQSSRLLNERDARGGDQNRGQPQLRSSRTKTARNAGLSEYEQAVTMRVGSLPEEEFERNVKDPSLGQQQERIESNDDRWTRAVMQLATMSISDWKVSAADAASLLPDAERALKRLTAWVIELKKAKR
jgi:hypothetical protein